MTSACSNDLHVHAVLPEHSLIAYHKLNKRCISSLQDGCIFAYLFDDQDNGHLTLKRVYEASVSFFLVSMAPEALCTSYT